MNKYNRRLIIFPLLLLVILMSLVHIFSILVKSRNFKINETDSNTLVMKRNTHYDIILTGASHARNLSRYMNHYRVQTILDKSITNIAQGAATCGIAEQFFYFQYFIEENNTVDQLVYILSPPLLFSETLPFASNTFNEEYFSYRFFFRYTRFKAENKRQRLFEYVRSKLTWKWIFLTPNREEAMEIVLDKVDPTMVKEGIARYYKEEESLDRFNKSCEIIEEEIQYALSHDVETIFIIPPAVFGKWPGHERTVLFAREMQDRYGSKYYDFSESIMEPQYYYDHHHLNTRGVLYFAENYLKQIFY